MAEFAHVVSHDLQAPTRMVESFSDLLAQRYKGRLDTTVDQFIGTIQDGADTMEALIRTLLNYATIGQEPMILRSAGMPSGGVLRRFTDCSWRWGAAASTRSEFDRECLEVSRS